MEGTASVTRELARACRAIGSEELPTDAVYAAKQCLLDWLGVTVAGYGEPLARLLREEVAEQGGHARATIVGSDERVSAAQAALVNGATSHALDYDDVLLAMSGHPSVPVWPALLALAEERGSGPKEVLAAFVAGVEMEARIGQLVMPGHYAAGFHATGTLGAFGAAAACAHLLDLGEEQWLHALGIAGAQAAGLKSMFGTMCKPLHAGKAAQNGLLAATLAARGFTSDEAVLESAQGFTATQTRTPHPERALPGAGERYAVRDVLFKYHAACYGTHETIEAMLRARERGVTPEDVREVRLHVPAGHLAMCNIAQPSTPLEGKFSLRFTAALALATGDASEQAFTEANVRAPHLAALRDRVHVEAHEGPAGLAGGTSVEVALEDGREFTEAVNLNLPATDLDLQWERLAAKFRSLVEPVIGREKAARALAGVRAFERCEGVAAILALLAP